jgi:hypothetical protein
VYNQSSAYPEKGFGKIQLLSINNKMIGMIPRIKMFLLEIMRVEMISIFEIFLSIIILSSILLIPTPY